MDEPTFEPDNDRYFVSYYDLDRNESLIEELPRTGRTDLKLHVGALAGLAAKRPHEEFRLLTDAIVTGYTYEWSQDPKFMEKVFCEGFDIESPVLWINEHGPFPYSMGRVRFDADGIPIDYCPHCAAEYRDALGEPQADVFV